MAMPITAGSPFITNPAYSGTFIPTLWSSKLNVRFFETTVFGEIANTDWESEIKGFGDTIIINSLPDVAISDWTVDKTLTYPVMTPNKLELTIDKAKDFSFRLDDVITYQSSVDLMNSFTSVATTQMGIAIDREVLLYTLGTPAAANKGAGAGIKSGAYALGTDNAPIAKTPANALQMVLDLASVLDEQNVPSENRCLVVNPLFRNLLFQSDLKMVYITGDNGSPLRNGKIGTVDRFTVYVSNNLPVADADENFAGTAQAGAAARMAVMACHKSALTFASQYTKMETMRNPSAFGDLVRGLNVYGYKTVKPESLAVGLMAR